MPKRRANETSQQRKVRLQKKREQSARWRKRTRADPVRRAIFLARRRRTQKRQKKREQSARWRKRTRTDPGRRAIFLARRHGYRESKRRSLQSTKDIESNRADIATRFATAACPRSESSRSSNASSQLSIARVDVSTSHHASAPAHMQTRAVMLTLNAARNNGKHHSNQSSWIAGANNLPSPRARADCIRLYA